MPALTPVPDLVLHEEDGEGFILHLTDGMYFSLNPSGLIAWNALSRGEDPLEALAAAYPGVPPEDLGRDWEALREALLAQGLVTPS